jgi:uroporphyrinogen-III synthase
MPNISKLFTDVSLKYYHYDLSLKTFIIDQKFIEESSQELISITNRLVSHDYTYTIDARSNIHITNNSSIKELSSESSYEERDIYILSDKKNHNTENLPVVTTKVIPREIDFNQYDILLFLSKNAVLSMDSFNTSWREKPSYAMTEQTGKAIQKLKGALLSIDEDYTAHEFEQQLSKRLEGKRVLCIRSKEASSDLKNKLDSQNIVCDEAIVYETVCKRQISKTILPKNSIIIFSSPSTVDCFFLNKEWDRSYKAITIGKTTAEYLPEYISPHIVESKSIESCIREALIIETNKKMDSR